MKMLSKEQFLTHKETMLEEILAGKIFIYPTDTIYGLGCNALISEFVEKIRLIKKREQKPFSVIAPSKNWIMQNCQTSRLVEKWLNELPGKYTLILNLKNKSAISPNANLNSETIGVRIPKNWFSELISELNIPFVTTSVNISGQPNIHNIKEIPKEILDRADYVIDDGSLNNEPSTIVNLTNGKEEILKR